MSVIERCARAAEFADENFVADFPGVPEVARADPKWSQALVRAVLQAIRTPTDDMLWAGERASCHLSAPVTKETWQAMVDQALAE